VGSAKSGTTSLYNYLREHPSIFMPNLKEPRFFTFYGEESVDIPGQLKSKAVTNKNQYISLFRDATNSQITGEASPIYLFLYQKTIQNISSLVTDFYDKKIIIILRNPIERAFSHYRMYLVNRTENDFFSNAIQNEKRNKLLDVNPFYDYVHPGFYYSQVKAYMSSFNKVFVCLYDDLKNNPQDLIKNLYEFLTVDSQFAPNYQTIYNVGGVKEMYTGMKGNLRRVKHYIEERVVKKNFYPYPYKNEEEMYQDYFNTYPYLYSIFEQDILNLGNLINRDLSMWKIVPSNKKTVHKFN
jgi:hypothetical protein